MFDRNQKTAAFKTLSNLLLSDDGNYKDDVAEAMTKFKEACVEATCYNVWFTSDNIAFALKNIGTMLSGSNLDKWLASYPEKIIEEPKTVGVVMAGNIPMVGFHDFLCVLMSGHKFLGKLSHDDSYLLPALADILIALDSRFRDMISFTSEPLKNFDAIIATGSDNTSRYFEYYFGKYPHIIRKNRNGIAVFTGEETKEDYENFALDVFTYFGLGCRSVSTIFVPRGFDFRPMLDTFMKYEYLKEHSRYFHNYEYIKAICLVDGISHSDNGFLIVEKFQALASPVAVLHYQEYDKIEQVEEFVSLNRERIQCVVSRGAWFRDSFDFGKAQSPELRDYADGVDTMNFLNSL